MPNPADYQLEIADGIVVIKNQNTTIGYSRFTSTGDVEYIYVNPMYRRQGYGTLLVQSTRQYHRLEPHSSEPWTLPCPIQLYSSQPPKRGDFGLSSLM